MIHIILTVLAVVLTLPLSAAADYSDMYPQTVLAEDAERYKRFIGELYTLGIRPHLTDVEQQALDKVGFDFPLPEPGDYLLDFYVYNWDGRPYVALPLMSMKVVEDIMTARAWLWANGYSFDTVDIYAAMLQYKPITAFPSGRYPPPLEALGVPSNALSDERVDGMSLRLRNSAMAFILLHELGHVLYGHGGYEGISIEQARANEREADRFALEVIERTKIIPMGMLMFFQAQVYSLPHRVQFASDAEWQQYLASQATHPMTADRLHAMAEYMNDAAWRESHPDRAGLLIDIATQLTEIASVLEDLVLGRCIVVAGTSADLETLKPRHEFASSQMEKWCGEDQ